MKQNTTNEERQALAAASAAAAKNREIVNTTASQMRLQMKVMRKNLKAIEAIVDGKRSDHGDVPGLMSKHNEMLIQAIRVGELNAMLATAPVEVPGLDKLVANAEEIFKEFDDFVGDMLAGLESLAPGRAWHDAVKKIRDERNAGSGGNVVSMTTGGEKHED